MMDLKQRDWLDSSAVQRAFDVLEQEGDVARAVGGTVRNSLLGEVVDDVDIACTALPDVVLARAKAAGVKAVPTGVDHGTVTLVIDHLPIEVTSLREDIETHGRHATVKFGRDWTKDAQRRDFTMNAIYVDRHGELFDPLGGLMIVYSGICGLLAILTTAYAKIICAYFASPVFCDLRAR